MCLGIPGRVVEIVPGYADQLALVDVVGAQRRVNVGMLDTPPRPGDWLLIHMGFALEIIDAAAAEQAMEGLELVGQARAEGPRSDQPGAEEDEDDARPA
jgi:hydrogenase maturation protein HypF